MSPQSRHRDGRRGKSARAKRRACNQAQRQLRRTAISGKQAYATLLAVLAQKGGEVVITQGTIDQVSENYNHLAWVVEKGKETNEYIVRLIDATPESVSDAATGGDGEDRGEDSHDGGVGHAAPEHVSGDL